MSDKTGTNPAVIRELKRIAAANGGELQPAAVVNAARNPQSILHSKFDWDDSSAAEKYRLHQARNIINITVEYLTVKDGETVACDVFVSLTPHRQDASGYRLMAGVMSDADLRAQLLSDAKAEMKQFTAKYRRLTELCEVFDAIEDVLASTPPSTETTATL